MHSPSLLEHAQCGWERQHTGAVGKHTAPRAACPARLGDPSASISPGLQKRPWKHLSFGSAGKIRHFPKVGKRKMGALQAQLPAGACLALPELEEDFHQFPLA